MTNKEIYPKLNEIPYYNTQVSTEKTKIEIIRILEKYGIKNHQWTTLDNNKEILKFIFNGVVQGKKVRLGIHLDIPVIKARKGRYDEIVEVPKEQRFRMFYYSIKSLLEATQYGIMKTEEIFYSYIITQLPNGKIGKVKDLIEHQLLLPEQPLE